MLVGVAVWLSGDATYGGWALGALAFLVVSPAAMATLVIWRRPDDAPVARRRRARSCCNACAVVVAVLVGMLVVACVAFAIGSSVGCCHAEQA
eukprot:924431-Prymnesium_polylepis.1